MRKKSVLAVLMALIIVITSMCAFNTNQKVNAEGNDPGVLRSVKFSKDSVFRPGYFDIELDVQEKEHGISDVMIYLVCLEGDTYYNIEQHVMNLQWHAETEEDIVKDGVIKIDAWIGDSTLLGEWFIDSLTLYYDGLSDSSVEKYYSYGHSFISESETDAAIRKIFDKTHITDENGVSKTVDEKTVLGQMLTYYGEYDGEESKYCEEITDIINPVICVKEDTNFDVITSDDEKDLLEIVNNLSEGQTIGIRLSDKGLDNYKEYRVGEEGKSSILEYSMPCSVISKDIFSAIKGKDITLVIYRDGFRWVFYGKDIKTPKDINPWIEILARMCPYAGDTTKFDWEELDWDSYEYKPEDTVAVDMQFAPNGELPGKAEIRIKDDVLWKIGEGEYQKDKKVRLYYYNGTEYVEEKEANCSVTSSGEDKWLSFTITHNSNYVASYNDLSGKGVNSIRDEWIDGCYYGDDGSQTYPYTGSWKGDSNGWWFEDTSGWYPKDAWIRIDGQYYYFKSDGYAAMNEYYQGCWFNTDGSWEDKYFLSWKSNSTGWWVEDKSGWWPASSWLKIDGYWYYFDASGYMVTSQYVDGYWISADGVCY